MITQIRRIGNSAGVVIPTVMLKEVQFAIGTEIDMAVVDGTLSIRRHRTSGRRGSREISLDWLLEDFRDVAHDLIPGAYGAEATNSDEDSN